MGALSVTGNMGRKKRGGPYAAGVTFAPAPYAYRSQWRNDPEECGRQCARAIKDVIRFTTADDVAAFIAEPVMGEGGIIVLRRIISTKSRRSSTATASSSLLTKFSPALAVPEKCLPWNTTA